MSSPFVKPNIANVPDALRECLQWVVWRLVDKPGQSKPAKVPFNARTGEAASTTNHDTWSSFDDACQAYESGDYAGVGFVFTQNDPYVGVDLDGVRDPETGVINEQGKSIVASLWSYTEVSPSGKGLHVIGCGQLQYGAWHKAKTDQGEIEMYSEGRYFTITGVSHNGNKPRPVNDFQRALVEIQAKYAKPVPAEAHLTPAPVPTFDISDQELLEKACNASNGNKFRDLWAGVTSTYGGDDSAADMALCSLLAFWTGRDADWMDRLFRQSGLIRAKWDERHGKMTYGERTIMKAIEGCADVFKAGTPGVHEKPVSALVVGQPSPDLDAWEPPQRKPWPVLNRAALPGLAGDFVDLATANSEADPAAVLTTLLVRFGCEAGGPDPATRPHMFIGDSRHEPRLFAVVVGQSGKARKGTSAAPVKRLFGLGASGISMAVTSPGPLSSGEGIVHHVRDELRVWEVDKKTGVGIWMLKDPGISDKRLFICDEELASGLRCTKREGNTLSTALRGFWDDGTVQPLTKSSPTKTTKAHVSIVAHITLEELGRVLDDVELFNGFANRFLWTLARRTKLVSRPRPMPTGELAALQGVLLERIRFAHSVGLMTMDSAACELWDEAYPTLSIDRGGMFGAVVGRAEAQAQRLTMVYALLDGKPVVGLKHLEAALAFWRYSEASAAYIFGGRQADPLREKILAALRTAARSMTATELHRALGNSFSGEQLQTALEALATCGLVVHEKEATKTKPRNLFRLYEKSELSEFSLLSGADQRDNSENSENSLTSAEKWDGPAEVEL